MYNNLVLNISVVALISEGTPDSTVMKAIIVKRRRMWMTNDTEIRIRILIK